MNLAQHIINNINEADYQDSTEYQELQRELFQLNKQRKELEQNAPEEPKYDYKTPASGFSQEEWNELSKVEKEIFIKMGSEESDYDRYVKQCSNLNNEISKILDKMRRIRQQNFVDNGGNTFENNLPRKATKSDYEAFDMNNSSGDYLYYIEHPDYAKSKGYNYVYMSEMSPDEYIERCGKEIFDGNYRTAKEGMDQPEDVYKYADMMKQGVKFDLPYIDVKRKTQEGRHRALAAKELGIETIPVIYAY